MIIQSRRTSGRAQLLCTCNGVDARCLRLFCKQKKIYLLQILCPHSAEGVHLTIDVARTIPEKDLKKFKTVLEIIKHLSWLSSLGCFLSIYSIKCAYILTHLRWLSWQSARLRIRGLWVQIPPSPQNLFFNFFSFTFLNIEKRNKSKIK